MNTTQQTVGLEITLSCSHTQYRVSGEGATPCAKCAAMRAALPALVGSEKQIVWANDIRFNAVLTMVREYTLSWDDSVAEVVESGTSAKFWIDNRATIISAINNR